MTLSDGARDQLPVYARGNIWHVLDGDGADAPLVGRVFVFMCGRWLRASRAEGVTRGVLPRQETLCRTCEIQLASVEGQPPEGAAS